MLQQPTKEHHHEGLHRPCRRRTCRGCRPRHHRRLPDQRRDDGAPSGVDSGHGQVPRAWQGREPPRRLARGNGNGSTDRTKPVRDVETLVTGDVATRVATDARAKEPDATIERVDEENGDLSGAGVIGGAQ